MQLAYALFLLLSIGNATPLLFWVLTKKRFPKFSKIFILFIIIFSSIQIGIGIDEIGGFKKERDFQKLKRIILQQDSDAERRMFALMLASEGMRKEYDKGFHKKEIKTLIVQMRDTALFSPIFADYNVHKKIQDIGNNGLHLSQLSILLSNYYHITEDNNVQGVYSQINTFLDIKMSELNGGNLQSYSGIPQQWLCDNAEIMYALALFDEELGQYSHEKVLPVWLNKLKKDFIDSKTQLPCSQVTENKGCYEAARGSSSAWLIAYFALLDLPEGKAYWQIFKKEFKVNILGVGAAFKEYPDYKNTEDYDSGPIILGLGTYSSGLSIYTAACCQDAFTYLQLKNAFWVVSWAQFLLQEEDLLITALLYNAETKW